MTLTIGIDVGTQGVKGVILDGARAPGEAILARAHAPLSLIEGLPPGAAEQSPEVWWSEAKGVIARLLATPGVDAAAVRGIGVSGQQHGSVFLDGEGRVLRPAKLWCDTSTAEWAERISARVGRRIPVGFTASKIAWLASREPANWGATATVLLPHDFINLRLTGRAVMEAGDASGTGCFDPVRRAWDLEVAAAIHPELPGRLPPLIAPDEAVGPITPAIAAELGLSPTVLVSCGGGDNMMSAIGAGATRAGVVVMSLGTSATVFSRCDAPVIDPEGLIAPFCSSDGAWLPLLCTMNCTNVVEELRAAFAPGDPTALERWTDEAGEIPAGGDGLTFIPFLQGERVPDRPDATGILTGIRPGLLRPARLLRAALEGVTANLALGVERLRALGVEVAEVRLVGGGSRNPLWRTLVADLLGARVLLPVEQESAALGGALQALALVAPEVGGVDGAAARFVPLHPEGIDPDPARRRALAPVLERHRSAIEALDPTPP